MIVRSALLVVVLAVGVASAAEKEQMFDFPSGFINGNDWNRMSENERNVYAMGVIDGLQFGLAFDKNGTTLSWVEPCTVEMTARQVSAMLNAEIQAKPGERHKNLVALMMYRALRKACPHSPENAK